MRFSGTSCRYVTQPALLRLSDAQQVIDRVAFHNTGTSQLPGLIAMSVSDGVCAGNDLDPNYDGVLLMFNADDQALSFDLSALPDLELHPVLASGNEDAGENSDCQWGNLHHSCSYRSGICETSRGQSRGISRVTHKLLSRISLV